MVIVQLVCGKQSVFGLRSKLEQTLRLSGYAMQGEKGQARWTLRHVGVYIYIYMCIGLDSALRLVLHGRGTHPDLRFEEVLQRDTLLSSSAGHRGWLLPREAHGHCFMWL